MLLKTKIYMYVYTSLDMGEIARTLPAPSPRQATLHRAVLPTRWCQRFLQQERRATSECPASPVVRDAAGAAPRIQRLDLHDWERSEGNR